MAEVRLTLEEYNALLAATGADPITAVLALGRQGITPGALVEEDVLVKPRPKRKTTARDRAMKKAIPIANKRYKKKNGQFRKGRTQKDVMRLANKLADEMMK